MFETYLVSCSVSSVLANQNEGKSISSDAVAVETASELWITQEDNSESFPEALEPGISLSPLDIGGSFFTQCVLCH